MKLARITAAIAFAATLATPLAVSASEEQNPAAGIQANGLETNGQTMTSIESLRYGRSERSDPNWDRLESNER